ncbi:MAG: hypothetical protein IKM59_01710 [Oscillospiraceae bacterium]|nr:hypothetical protein [Oscillospiraceae bacterium]
MMKKLLILCLLLSLLLVGCGKKSTPVETGTTAPASTEDQGQSTALPETTPTPANLIGTWRSLDPGELDIVETIELMEDGTVTVSCTYQGKDAGSIYGTYYIVNETLHCDMTSNNAPYIVEYRFELDGRELALHDDDGVAHYIKVS